MLKAAQTNLTARSNMKKNSFSRAGSEAQYGPRLAGAVLHDYLENSDDALAVAYREHTTDDEEDNRLFRGYYPDTHLGVDLKVIARKPGRMPVGAYINCLLTRDGEYHFEAVETASEMKRTAEQRNPIVYQGTCINVHRKADGTIYPTFNRPGYTADFTFADFCREAAEELRAVAGLVGK